MGGTATKTLLALAIAAALAVGLAACGGGDDSSSTQTTATGSEPKATTPAGGEDDGATGKQPGDDKGGASGSSDSDSGSGGEDRANADEPSAEFRTPGGDNSIQNYGEEADRGEVEAAEKAIVGYLEARAARNWSKSCEYLAKMAAQPLEQLAEKAPQLKGKDCGAIIGALSGQVPKAALANPAVEGIAAVRFKGDRGFALFHGPNGARYFMPLVKEDGQWKVGALVASEFP